MSQEEETKNEVKSLKEKVVVMESLITNLTSKLEKLISQNNILMKENNNRNDDVSEKERNQMEFMRKPSSPSLERRKDENQLTSSNQNLSLFTESRMEVGTISFYQQMLRNNKYWSQLMIRNDPNYFTSRAKIQKPHVFWIGCSDSRVHPSDLTGLLPGEVFVHRNVANQCIQSDINMLSVLQYAVEVLKVPEVVVVGHYGCGGVQFAMRNEFRGIINQWVSHIKEIYEKYYDELELLNEEDKCRRLVELNIIEQAKNICKISYIQKSWKKNFSTDGDPLPRVHAWVYDLNDGLIRELPLNIKLLPFQNLDFTK